MRAEYRDRKPAPKLDAADKAARDALRDFRKGSHISGGCVEIYAAVSDAIRKASKSND